MKVKKLKKILAAALSAAMIFTMVPSTAFAEEAVAEEVVEEEAVELAAAEDEVVGTDVDACGWDGERQEWNFRNPSDLLPGIEINGITGSTAEGLFVDATTTGAKWNAAGRDDWAQFNTGTEVYVPVPNGNPREITVETNSASAVRIYTDKGEDNYADAEGKTLTQVVTPVKYDSERDRYEIRIKSIKNDYIGKITIGDEYIGDGYEHDFVADGAAGKTVDKITDISGITIGSNISVHSSHGLHTGAADATLTLKLDPRYEAIVTVEGCQYGAGKEQQIKVTNADETTNVVPVKNDNNDDKYTITSVKGDTVLAFASDAYIHAISVEYIIGEAYNITVSCNVAEYGKVTANPVKAAAGTKVTLKAEPEYGYELDKWEVHEDAVTIVDNTFTMPAKAVYIKAIFKEVEGLNEITVKSSDDAMGTVTVNHPKATEGTEIKLTVDPKSGYVFDKWEVTDNAVTIVDNTFTMPAKAVGITAVFKAKDMSATVEEGLYKFATGNSEVDTIDLAGAKSIAGISFNDDLKNNGDHGLTNVKTITLNLKESANVMFETCQHGAGTFTIADGHGTITNKLAAAYTIQGSKETLNGWTVEKMPAGETVVTIEGTVYLHAINVEYIQEIKESELYDTDLIDVYDFGGGVKNRIKQDSGSLSPDKYEYFTAKDGYNNVLTADVIQHMLYGDKTVAEANADSLGGKVGAFSYETDFDGKLRRPRTLIAFDSYKVADGVTSQLTNNRLRTFNANIAAHDQKELKLADGSQYFNGYIYSNNGTTPTVAMKLYLAQGDIATVYVASNGGASNIQVEAPSGEVCKEYNWNGENSGIAEAFTFYASDAGLYRIYSTNEKLVFARALVAHPKATVVTGKVNAPASLTGDYSIVFTDVESGAEYEAPVVDGKYTANIYSKNHKYKLSLAGADEFAISAGKELDLTEAKETATLDVSIVALDLFDITGTIKGIIDEGYIERIKLAAEFKSRDDGKENVYTPKFKINSDGTYSTRVEKGVVYSILLSEADDYNLVTKEIGPYTANATKDIELAAKDRHKITIKPVGLANAEDEKNVTGATYTFVRLDENFEKDGYKYVFTDASNIALRDGQYQIIIGGLVNYWPKRLTDVKVEGKDVVKEINFVYRGDDTKWVFTDASFVGGNYSDKNQEYTFNGLKFKGAVNNKDTYLNGIEGGYVEIPVKGDSIIEIKNCYEYRYTVGTETGTVTENAEKRDIKATSADKNAKDPGVLGTTNCKTGSTSAIDTFVFDYKGGAGVVKISMSGTTYFNSIEVIDPSDKSREYKAEVTVNPAPAAKADATTINGALDIVRKMVRTADQRVTVKIAPGDYQEMLVIDTPNVTFKNASPNPGIGIKNKGKLIQDNAVRITSYYGHGYAYYSMGTDCKYNEDILAVNKENGYLSFENPGTGTTSGSYWNATVCLTANGFTAENIIFENSFNQYVSSKAADDVIVPVTGAKELSSNPRADLPEGSTLVQNKAYVERAAAFAIYNGVKQTYFDKCKFIGRQDVLYGGTDSTVALNRCDIYGGTDYIFGGMVLVANKCNLVANTDGETDTDNFYITAPQQSKGRGYLMYMCNVVSTTPGIDTAAPSICINRGGFGRAWQGDTSEAVFYKTKVGVNAQKASLIDDAGWFSGLSAGSALCGDIATIELTKLEVKPKRDMKAFYIPAAEDTGKLPTGETIELATWLGDWAPMELTKEDDAALVDNGDTCEIYEKKIVGEGTVDAVLDKDKKTVTVTVEPAKGYYTSRVVVAPVVGEAILDEAGDETNTAKKSYVAQDIPEMGVNLYVEFTEIGEKPAPITPSGNVVPDKPAQPDDKPAQPDDKPAGSQPAKPVVPGGATVIGADGKPFVLTEAQAATVATDYAKIAGKLASKGNDTIKVISAITDKGQLEITYKKGKPAKIVATSLDGVSKVFDVTVNAGTKIVVPGTKADPGTATPSEAVKVKAKYNKKADGVVIATKNSKSVPTYDVVYTNDTNGYKITVHVVCVNINKNYKKYTLSSAAKDSVTVTPVNGGILTGTWTVGKTVIKSVNEQQNVQISKKLKADIVVNPNGTITIINPSGKGAIKLTYTINGKKYNTSVKVVDKPLNDKQKSNNSLAK